MVDSQQLELLRQGAEVWNQWRKENPELKPNLRKADLSDVNRADLSGADLRGAYFGDAEFSNSIFGWTMLGDVDLSQAKGLDRVRHHAPSTIGIDTIYKSKGQIRSSSYAAPASSMCVAIECLST